MNFPSFMEGGLVLYQIKWRRGETGKSSFVVPKVTQITQPGHEKKSFFFRSWLFAVIRSIASFAVSSRQFAHQITQANCFGPRGNSNDGFSSKEILRTPLPRLIFCTGTVYYLNKLQVATHPSSFRCPVARTVWECTGLAKTSRPPMFPG